MNPGFHFSTLTTVGNSLFASYLCRCKPQPSIKDPRSSPVQQKHNSYKWKPIFVLLFSILAISAYGQDKYNYLYANRPMELAGTEYVLSKVENWGKMAAVRSQYFLFINTRTGHSTKVDFPRDGSIQWVEQIKIDSLQINRILVIANTVNLDNSKRIDWSDPAQLIVLSVDGQEKVQLTDDNFFVRSWVVNSKTGNIVVTGHSDANGNGKYDKTDEYEILLYDLKTSKLISKVRE